MNLTVSFMTSLLHFMDLRDDELFMDILALIPRHIDAIVC